MFSVQYWNPEWQKMILSIVDNVISGGYDGLLLDSTLPSDWLANNTCNNLIYPDASQKLADFINIIKKHIQSKNLAWPFYLIPNLVDHKLLEDNPEVLSNFDAIFHENVTYYGNVDANNVFQPGVIYNGAPNASKLRMVCITPAQARVDA